MYQREENSVPGTWEKKYQTLFKEIQPEFEDREVHWVGVDVFRAGGADEILFTNGLNSCTGIAIKTEHLTFIAHASHDHSVTKMREAIERKIDPEEISTASVKIALGESNNVCKSLNTALKLLFELGLLDKFIAQLQNYLRNCEGLQENMNVQFMGSEMFSVTKMPQMFWNLVKGDMKINEFFNLVSIDQDFEIDRLARFLDRIKGHLVDAKDSPLQKIGANENVTTLETVSLGNVNLLENSM